jgi:hypothetical protein
MYTPFLSSLIFTTNIITAYLNEYYFYSFLFVILTITSLIVHSNDNIYTNVIDKFAVVQIVSYGAYTLYRKINMNNILNCSTIIAAFLWCVYFYLYGFLTKKYCFCNEKCIAQRYHCLMHIIASLGHHFIIFL